MTALRIVNCILVVRILLSFDIDLPKVNSVKCKENTFRKTISLNLRQLPSLVDFSCDLQSFTHTELLPIEGMKKLELRRFGDTSFLRTSMFYLFDAPRLKTVIFGPRSFLHALTFHFGSMDDVIVKSRITGTSTSYNADEQWIYDSHCYSDRLVPMEEDDMKNYPNYTPIL